MEKDFRWPLTCKNWLRPLLYTKNVAEGCSHMTLASTRWRRTVVMFSLAAIFSFVSQDARSATANAGRYGGAFLRIPVGARLTASPDVVAGWRPDASLAFSNPAFLAPLRDRQIFFTTATWLEDMRFSAASATLPLGEKTTLSLGTVFLYSGGLQGLDSGLNVVSEENYYDLGIYAGASRQFGPFGIGAGATMIRQHTLPSDGTGVAFNAGLTYRFRQTMFQLAGRNLEGMIHFDDAEYRVDSETMVGVSHSFNTQPGHLIAGAQLIVSDARSDMLRLGIDYDISQLLTLRTGVHASGSEGSGVPLEAGFGLRYETLQIEYAYTPQEFFSSTHTLSLVVSLRSWGQRSMTEPAPTNQLAPHISDSQIQAPPPATPTVSADADLPYLVVAGTHDDLSSARAEVRALSIVGIEAFAESFAGQFRVVVGRYGNRGEAEEAFIDYARRGYRFVIVGP